MILNDTLDMVYKIYRGNVKMRFSVSDILQMVRDNDMRRFYNSWEWRKLSHQIIEEGHKECYICKHRGRVTPAVITHHVNELKKRPDLAYSRTYIDDKGNTQRQLIPLCFQCHEEIHERYQFKTGNGFKNEERW